MPISAAGQKWDSDDARFVRKIMEEVADEGVNEILCMCSAQSAKTLTLLCLVAWIIAEDPGPILWVTSSLSEAKKLAKSRLMPLLERCLPVAERMPTARHMKTTLEIYFPGAPLIIAGAESPSSLQSTPFRYVILDEARQYKPGAIEMVSKRFRSYTHNYKKIVISTPSMEGDAVDRAFLSGDQQRWLVACPKCGERHEMRWGASAGKGGLKWDKNEVTFDAEKNLYVWEELEKTIRYECWAEGCDRVMRDEMANRKYISGRGGLWVAGNPAAPSNVKSHTWNALVPWWASWKDQVREFLTAKRAMDWADWTPLKDHVNETRGETWADRLRYRGEEKFLEEREVEYDPRAVWEAEMAAKRVKRALRGTRRFMTVDVQGRGGRHFYYVVRTWIAGGKSRRLDFGILYSYEEIKAKATEWGVDQDDVALDAGAYASEVYQEVVRSGYRWKALKGDDRTSFRTADGEFLWRMTKADPAIGTAMEGRVRKIDLRMWAKYGVLDRLLGFMHGILGDWQIDRGGSDEDYTMQVTCWDRRTRTDGRGIERVEFYQKRKEDHYSDCEQMQVLCAAATDLLSMPADVPLFTNQVREVEEEAPED